MAYLDSQRTYRVVGSLRVHDTPPGAQFIAALDPGRLAIGHIAVVPDEDDANKSDAESGAAKEA